MKKYSREKTALCISIVAALSFSISSCSIYDNYKREVAAKIAEEQQAEVCAKDRKFISDRLATIHERHETIQANVTVNGWIGKNQAYIERTDKWTGEAFERLGQYQKNCKKDQYRQLVGDMRTKHPYLFENYDK